MLATRRYPRVASASPPFVMIRELSLEDMAPYEYVEVTPKIMHLRKKTLDPNLRQRAGKA